MVSLLVASLLSAVDRTPWPSKEVTVFHVNPLHEGVLPLDMDTADLQGDIFFDLRSRTLPIECANGTSSARYSSDCSNGEVVDNDLVITKLKLSLRKSEDFGPYGRVTYAKEPVSSAVE